MPSTTTETCTANSTTRHLSVLVSQTSGVWIAECIEHHLATQADTRHQLDRQIALMFVAHETACKEVGIEPYRAPLAPVALRMAYDVAPRCSRSWVFTPGGSLLRLTIREAGAS